MTHQPIFSFLHLAKTGGITLETLLRRHFGIRHLDVTTKRGWRYSAEDMRADLRWNPFVRSMSGHHLRPFIDYQENAERLVWYTMLREPVSRYISQYQHAVEKRNPNLDFDAYLRDASQSNWQVNKIAGAWDLAAAKQIVAERFRCVGLLEHYDASLLLIRARLGLKDFNVAYGKPRNVAKTGETRKRIMADMDIHRARVLENNALDHELYRYVADEVYPRQVAEYGAERLARDLATEFGEPRTSLAGWMRETANDSLRKTVYRTLVRMRARRERQRGAPFVRS